MDKYFNIKDYEIKPEMTDLEKIQRKMKNIGYMVTSLENTNEEKYLAFSDNQGLLMDVETMKMIISELQKTVSLDGLDKFIEECNKDQIFHNHLDIFFKPDTEIEGKYLLPFDEIRVTFNTYNAIDREKNWGITCACCGEKVSTKNSPNGIIKYFSIMPNYTIETKEYISIQRACSESCTKVITKEILLNWISVNKYQKYFNLDKLDKKLIAYIRKC